jgi:hypothetical protein
MRYKVLSILFVFCLWPMQSAAVTRETFLVRTTQELVDLCTAPETDPLHAAAIGFCFGYVIGAYHYYMAEQAGPDMKPMFCLPEPQPERRQAVQMFVGWAKQNSQYMGERPVDSLMRFATWQWPCPTA